MRRTIDNMIPLLITLSVALGCMPARAQNAVLQYHADAQRSGHYITQSATPTDVLHMQRQPVFQAAIKGPVYAQPLYWQPSGGDPLLIVVTEQDVAEAINPRTAKPVWAKTLATPVPLSSLPCGNINPMGITGTPVIDGGRMYLDAMALRGDTPEHLIFALNARNGDVLPGWPVDVARALDRQGKRFIAANQGQRGALATGGGRVFVAYGGLYGDCAFYHGWVVGVGLKDPSALTSWNTVARSGGIWAPGGIVKDGSSLLVTTGNTMDANRYGDGEAVLRLGFHLHIRDFFAPANWKALDNADLDLSGTNATIVGRFVLALGKDGDAYLLDRHKLGGIGGALLVKRVSSIPIRTATATYMLDGVHYVVFQGQGIGCPGGRSGDLVALRIGAGDPPSMNVAWCANEHGRGAPIVTTTNGTSDPIVWAIGAEGDERLRAFRGSDGIPLFTSAPMTFVRRFETPIVAGGRIYVAADSAVYGFALSK